MTIYLIVGMPGSGKTTRARELEISGTALRLTPDDWQMAVFDADPPTRWRSKERADQRFRLEGKLLEIGLRAAQLGLDVVFDFGFWSEAERSALRWLASSLGVSARVVYLPVDYEEQRRRIAARVEVDPGQFRMSDAELERWHQAFQAPGHEELTGGPIPAVPPGCQDWSRWASTFWPSLPDVASLEVASPASDGQARSSKNQPVGGVDAGG